MQEEEEASLLQSRIIALLNIGKGYIGVVRPPIKVIQSGVNESFQKRLIYIGLFSRDPNSSIHPSKYPLVWMKGDNNRYKGSFENQRTRKHKNTSHVYLS